jgi:hypothetical protein
LPSNSATSAGRRYKGDGAENDGGYNVFCDLHLSIDLPKLAGDQAKEGEVMNVHEVCDMRDWPDIWDEGDDIIAMVVLNDHVWLATKNRVYIILAESEKFEDYITWAPLP